MAEIFGFDAYAPKEVAERVETVGVAKARLPLLSQIALGVLAGGFIGLGALYFTLVTSDAHSQLRRQPRTRRRGLFVGLILVVVAGAELFTGNNLLVMAWASRRLSTNELLRNWLVVFFANFAGALGLVGLVYLSNHWQMNGGAVGIQAVKIAAAKAALPFAEAFFKGLLCNILVCLAVWLALAGRSIVDKICAIVFPISAFVAAGFEHSIANMYFIPLGILLKDQVPAVATEQLSWTGLWWNLAPVTLGNIAGGSLMVALVYYFVYRRSPEA